MSKTAKIILAMVGVMFLLAVGTCGAGYLWVQKNKDSFIAEAKQIGEEATAFGAQSDQAGCLKETLRRVDTCTGGELAGAVCRGKKGSFLGLCLQKAQPTPGFCDGAPGENDILAIAAWSVRRCVDMGRGGDQACSQLLNAVVKACAENAKGSMPK